LQYAQSALWVAIVLFLWVKIFVLFTLLLLVLVVPVVGVLLWHISLLLLALLWPESSDVLLRGRVAGFLLLIDDVDHGFLSVLTLCSVKKVSYASSTEV
jgi:hypothetical protein